MAKKFYAQKDALGFPIPGTMMSGVSVPNQKNLIEIKSGLGLGTHPQKFKYYVRKDKKGNIIPNSLFTSYKIQSTASTIDLHAVGGACIQFVADTTLYNQTNFGMRVGALSDVTYTATWGDGTTSEGTILAGDPLEILHDYTGQNTAYNVQLCFSDGTKVTYLEFYSAD
jgi:hypothetical protein